MPIEDDTWPLVTIHDLALAYPGKLVSPEDTSGLEADQDDPDEVESAQFREIPEPTGEAELKLDICMGGLNAAQLAAVECGQASIAAFENRDRQADADAQSIDTAEATPHQAGPAKLVGEAVGAETTGVPDLPTASTVDSDSAQTEWSEPMSRTEMARRILRNPNARLSQGKDLLDRYGIEQIGREKSRLYRVRIDKMDTRTRQNILKPL